MKSLCVLFFLFSFSSSFAAETSGPIPAEAEVTLSPQGENSTSNSTESLIISRERYIGGGVLGTVLGFGLGHLVQSRPESTEKINFMATELVVLGGASMLLIINEGKECTQGGSAEEQCLSTRRNGTKNILILAAASFVGLRIWEIYDLWSYPHVAEKKSPQAALFVLPQSTDQAAASFVINF